MRGLAPDCLLRSVLHILSAARATVLRIVDSLLPGRLLFRGRERSKQSPPWHRPHTRGLYQGVHAQFNNSSSVGRYHFARH